MMAALNPKSVVWLFPILFAILAVSVFIWFVLMARLHRILRTRHSETYDRLGRPTLFLNNSIRNGAATIRFLLGGHFRQLRDPELLKLAGFMQVFFYAYSALFAVLIGLILVAPYHPR